MPPMNAFRFPNTETDEIFSDLELVMIGKVHSLLALVMEKFTDSEYKFDIAADFNNKRNILNCIDECICKIADIKMEDFNHFDNILKETSNIACDEDVRIDRQKYRTQEYNLKLKHHKITRIKKKCLALETKLHDQNYRSKEILKIAKFLTSKYHEHVQEIGEKVVLIDSLEETNVLLKNELRRLFMKLKTYEKQNETHFQDCICKELDAEECLDHAGKAKRCLQF